MCINGGYVLKPRTIKDSWISHAAPVVREVWDWLIMNANYKDVKYNGFTVERGQVFCSYQEVRECLSWFVGYRKEMYSENQMKHAMKQLSNNGMIKPTKQPRGMLITICNYSKYQDSKNYESTSESTVDQPMSEPSINQSSLSISKEVKEVKKERSKTLLSFDREMIKGTWNQKAKNLGLPQIRSITDSVEKGLNRLYKSYLKQCSQTGVEPKDMNTLINGYIEHGYQPTAWAMGDNPEGKKYGIDTALTQKKIDEILGAE